MILSGLKEIIGDTATLHGIEMPPERDQFADEEAYERAHHEWWLRTTFWKADVR
jgi:hypothetical protein